MTRDQRFQEQVVPRRVDVVLRDTMALLELVRREEQVLVRLRGCVVELEAIHRARSVLGDRTESEVAEADHRLAYADAAGDAGGSAVGGWGR